MIEIEYLKSKGFSEATDFRSGSSIKCYEMKINYNNTISIKRYSDGLYIIDQGGQLLNFNQLLFALGYNHKVYKLFKRKHTIKKVLENGYRN